MKIYLVGGAVRDELLGRPIKEKDWVVVGSTPEEMIKLGYQPVGKDFPVFLHPKTHEEYALARTERKTAKGYKGFQFYASPDVTLEADLVRRDLTINAMAKNIETGEITDPFDGQKDLQHKILRHVSPAFSEDPVRILRVARFAAQFPAFSVHAKTNQLMHHMVKVGEADALVAERVWKELSRALMAEKPARFFDVLVECEAFSVLFPELKKEWRTDAFDRVVANHLPATSRFAAVLYGLSVEHIQSLCKRFRVPAEFSDMAILVSKYHERYEKLNSRDAAAILSILKSIDGLRRPERFLEWIRICAAIYPDIHHEKILLSSLAACKNIDVQSLVAKKLVGIEFAKAVEQLQIEVITALT